VASVCCRGREKRRRPHRRFPHRPGRPPSRGGLEGVRRLGIRADGAGPAGKRVASSRASDYTRNPTNCGVECSPSRARWGCIRADGAGPAGKRVASSQASDYTRNPTNCGVECSPSRARVGGGKFEKDGRARRGFAGGTGGGAADDGNRGKKPAPSPRKSRLGSGHLLAGFSITRQKRPARRVAARARCARFLSIPASARVGKIGFSENPICLGRPGGASPKVSRCTGSG
jgi:hypothetical protein